MVGIYKMNMRSVCKYFQDYNSTLASLQSGSDYDLVFAVTATENFLVVKPNNTRLAR